MFNRFKYTPPIIEKSYKVKCGNDDLDRYQEMCYERSIEELRKLTWTASNGEVVLGEMLFRIEELEKQVEALTNIVEVKG